MGRFEGKQLVKRKSPSYRAARCTILRGDDAWVVMHKGRHVGTADTYCEAETLANRETGRLDSIRDNDEAQANEQRAEINSEAAAAARAMGLRVMGTDMMGKVIIEDGTEGYDDDEGSSPYTRNDAGEWQCG